VLAERGKKKKMREKKGWRAGPTKEERRGEA